MRGERSWALSPYGGVDDSQAGPPVPDLSIFPVADGFRIWFCGSCPHAHLIFRDKKNVPICHAVISAAQAERLADTIRDRDPNFREVE